MWLGRCVLWLLRNMWEVLLILCSGGAFGKWVDREFSSYYRSPHWRRVRAQALVLVGHKCEVCGNEYLAWGRSLTVRHLHYYRDGVSVFEREDPAKDLVVLCEAHNQRGERVKHVGSWKRAYKWYGVLLK